LALVEGQQPSLSKKTKFTVGDTVTAEGLKANPQHNGKLAIVIGHQKQ
jgi:hypothetical protein